MDTISWNLRKLSKIKESKSSDKWRKTREMVGRRVQLWGKLIGDSELEFEVT
jgi:hypothetical protein